MSVMCTHSYVWLPPQYDVDNAYVDIRENCLCCTSPARSQEWAVAGEAPEVDRLCGIHLESVQSATLTLQGVHDVTGSDRLAAGVLGVGDGITDDVLQEHLQDTARLLIDEAGDALDTSTASQSADSRLAVCVGRGRTGYI
jgi:hypothetical protein